MTDQTTVTVARTAGRYQLDSDLQPAHARRTRGPGQGGADPGAAG